MHDGGCTDSRPYPPRDVNPVPAPTVVTRDRRCPAGRRGRLAPLLATVFFFSGLAGLIYQVAWQRLLTVHYGVGAVSITLIVSVYMLGLGLGSLLGGRLAERSREPYALYATIEGALGLTGLVSFPIILALGRLTAESTPPVSRPWLSRVAEARGRRSERPTSSGCLGASWVVF